MADRVHPMPPPSPPRPGDQQQPDAEDTEAAAAATETTPLQEQHPSFHRPPAPPPGTYIVQVPKDQVLRVPPPDRTRQYKKLAGRPARRRRLRRAFCFSCGALLLLILAAAAFVGAVYLVFRPRAPRFSVTSVRGLDALILTPPPTSPPELTVAVRADNSANRKLGVDYRGGGELAVSYSGQRLAAGPWPAFRQAPRNVTVVSASLRGNDAATLTDEQRRQVAAGAAPLTVQATVPVRLRFGKVLRTWTVDVRATCEVAVDRQRTRDGTVSSRGCRVRVKPLWWWW